MSPYITYISFSLKYFDRLPSAVTIDFDSVPSKGEFGKSGVRLAKLAINLQKTYHRESMPSPIDVLIA
jgi:hypothetical protein